MGVAASKLNSGTFRHPGFTRRRMAFAAPRAL
jgi:hypothetical protein